MGTDGAEGRESTHHCHLPWHCAPTAPAPGLASTHGKFMEVGIFSVMCCSPPRKTTLFLVTSHNDFEHTPSVASRSCGGPASPTLTALGPQHGAPGENSPEVKDKCTPKLLISGSQRPGLIKINKLARSSVMLVQLQVPCR